MIPLANHNARGNLVLSNLSSSDYAKVEPHLEWVQFRTSQRIEVASKRIERVFFPYRGLLSVVTVSANKRHEIDTGLIGWEGMTGFAVILDTEPPPTNIFALIEGDGRAIAVDNLRRLMDTGPTIRDTFLKFIHAFLVQAENTALANAKGRLDQRLARLLLMAHDRLRVDDLPLTHEFLAQMLGVRRASVTMALQNLDAQSLVSNSRRQITIRSREGLEQCCDGLYGVAERELLRLF